MECIKNKSYLLFQSPPEIQITRVKFVIFSDTFCLEFLPLIIEEQSQAHWFFFYIRDKNSSKFKSNDQFNAERFSLKFQFLFINKTSLSTLGLISFACSHSLICSKIVSINEKFELMNCVKKKKEEKYDHVQFSYILRSANKA